VDAYGLTYFLTEISQEASDQRGRIAEKWEKSSKDVFSLDFDQDIDARSYTAGKYLN
jgi:hypothetical protein